MRDSFWSTEEFWFFTLGIVLFLIPFFALPGPLWFYVFGHELTHAVWVLLMGGRVHKFHVTRDGGHILADKTNTFIALAPYFFRSTACWPSGLYGLAGLFWDVTPYRAVLYSVIGFTWAFHTVLHRVDDSKGPAGLHYTAARFFSLMVIYLLNILILAVLLIIASPQISAVSFGRELLHNAVNFTDWVERLARQMIRLVR